VRAAFLSPASPDAVATSANFSSEQVVLHGAHEPHAGAHVRASTNKTLLVQEVCNELAQIGNGAVSRCYLSLEVVHHHRQITNRCRAVGIGLLKLAERRGGNVQLELAATTAVNANASTSGWALRSMIAKLAPNSLQLYLHRTQHHCGPS